MKSFGYGYKEQVLPYVYVCGLKFVAFLPEILLLGIGSIARNFVFENLGQNNKSLPKYPNIQIPKYPNNLIPNYPNTQIPK